MKFILLKISYLSKIWEGIYGKGRFFDLITRKRNKKLLNL